MKRTITLEITATADTHELVIVLSEPFSTAEALGFLELAKLIIHEGKEKP